MRPGTQHALQRSVRKLAVDVQRARERKAASNLSSTLAEREEQVHIDVAGGATSPAVWTKVSVPFRLNFSTATDRRDSQLERPHFHANFELLSVAENGVAVADKLPLIQVMVIGWDLEDGLNITGATLAIGALSHDAELTFRGVVHATFQGYAVPQDPEPDQEG